MMEWPSNPLILIIIEGSSLTLITNMAARGGQLSCPLGVGGNKTLDWVGPKEGCNRGYGLSAAKSCPLLQHSLVGPSGSKIGSSWVRLILIVNP